MAQSTDNAARLGERRDSRAMTLAAAIIVGAAAFGAFLPALEHGFVPWDDPVVLLGNMRYRGLSASHLQWMFTTDYARQYHPLTWLSYGVDYSLWGMRARGYHLTNILIHALSAVGVFFLSRRLLAAAMPGGADEAVERRRPGMIFAAAASALFFALHPLRAESVAWVTERRGLLCALFFILALIAYLRAARPAAETETIGKIGENSSLMRRGWYWAAVALGAAALLSKAMAVSLPFALLLLDWHPLRRMNFQKRARRELVGIFLEKLPFLLPALIIAVVARVAQGDVIVTLEDRGLIERLLAASYAAIFYLRKTLLPAALSPYYSAGEAADFFQPSYVISLMDVILITALAALLLRRWRAGLALWLGYGLMAAPIIGIMPIGGHIAADRYTYLPCLPWALLFGAALLRGWRARRWTPWLASAAALALASLGMLAWRQAGTWRDPWRQVMVCEPGDVYGQNGYAAFLCEQERCQAALTHLERASVIEPGNVDSLFIVAGIDEAFGLNEMAAGALRNVLDERWDYHGANDNLGLLYEKMGRTAEAEACFLEAQRAEPESVSGYANLSNLQARQGDYPAAAAALRLGLRRIPSSQTLARMLAALLATAPDAAVRDPAEAARLARGLLARQARDPIAQEALAACLAEAGDFSGAMAAAELARRWAAEQGDVELARQIDEHLRLFKDKRVLRKQFMIQ